MRFEYLEHLSALLALPILIILFWWAWRARRRAIARFGEVELVTRLMPRFSKYRHYLKLGLLLLVLALLAIGWANPQRGSKLVKYERKSVDVIIAFDISQSMMAEDLSPNRLERARRFAQTIVEGLSGERIGLIYFAGGAYLQSPITADYNAVNLSLRSADPSMLTNQGTAIPEAIQLAQESYEEGDRSHRILILITDGENHEDGALEAARRATQEGIFLYTVGVGTAQGGFIPEPQRGMVETAYKLDRNGRPVRSRLGEEVLRELAKTGNGDYFNLSSGTRPVLSALKSRIENMEKKTLEQRTFAEYDSAFQWLVGPAILLLVLEFLLPYRVETKG